MILKPNTLKPLRIDPSHPPPIIQGKQPTPISLCRRQFCPDYILPRPSARRMGDCGDARGGGVGRERETEREGEADQKRR